MIIPKPGAFAKFKKSPSIPGTQAHKAPTVFAVSPSVDESTPSSCNKSVLEVDKLSICFSLYTRGFEQRSVQPIRNLSLSVEAGKLVALVGASGSGKSLLAQALMGILPANASLSGSMAYEGIELTAQRQRKLRGSCIAYIPQSVDCLDPLMKVGKQVRGLKGTSAQQRRLFRRAHLAQETENRYPFELSGGMARRVLVATAAMTEANLIIADEPTPGMTRAMAQEAMGTFRLLAQAGKAVLVITHDLGLAHETCDTIVVLYGGETLEVAPASHFSGKGELLHHPYSKALWKALPQNGFEPLSGSQPASNLACPGCAFADRCDACTAACRTQEICLRQVCDGQVRCIHVA